MAQALLKQASDLGVLGVAAPSANRFGRVSPTTAQHVLKEFAGSVPVLDGGACAVGIESTIVDCTGAQPILLRPGHLTQSRMEAVLGLAFASVTKHAVPRVSGSLASHYAPQARVRLLTPEDSSALAQQMQAHPRRVAVYTLPSSAEEAAHELFARLRDLDQAHVDEIWVSPIPDSEAWDGVRDRLQRAAYNKA